MGYLDRVSHAYLRIGTLLLPGGVLSLCSLCHFFFPLKSEIYIFLMWNKWNLEHISGNAEYVKMFSHSNGDNK